LVSTRVRTGFVVFISGKLCMNYEQIWSSYNTAITVFVSASTTMSVAIMYMYKYVASSSIMTDEVDRMWKEVVAT
jgi:hypothetical protein